MTTGLVVGMTLEEAGRAVVARAEEALAAGTASLAVWTETGKQSVLVGVARRGKASATMLIPKNEYDGLALLRLLMKEG